MAQADTKSSARIRFDIADVVRRHRGALEAETPLTGGQRRVLSAMAMCRTAELGGHVDVCHGCGFSRPAYNSCRNRHCPKCQAVRQEQWIAGRTERLVPVRHFHVVFTVPRELRGLGKQAAAALFEALFSAASATLMTLGITHLGARLGITMVLHTWTRELTFHPHVHALVTAGGLGEGGGRWIASSPTYLFPVRVMGALLRGKMIAALRAQYAQGDYAGVQELALPEAFERLMADVARINWVVYAKAPFRRVEHVLAYLGRYTHRVGISNSRLVAVTDDEVTFGTKKGKTKTLSPVEFLRRFVQHVLPTGFHKIRHYGLYAGAGAQGRRTAVSLLKPQSTAAPEPIADVRSWAEWLRLLTGDEVERCPHCGAPLDHQPLLTHPGQGPPALRRIAA